MTEQEEHVDTFVRDYAPEDSARIAFTWRPDQGPEYDDPNGTFRLAVANSVLESPGRASLRLIQDLFAAYRDKATYTEMVDIRFVRLAELLLTRGGEDVAPEFINGFLATFDTFGACHQMSIDPILLNRLILSMQERLDQATTVKDRKGYEMALDLFQKIRNGVAREGWVLMPPGTPVSDVRIVGRFELWWRRQLRRIKRWLPWVR